MKLSIIFNAEDEAKAQSAKSAGFDGVLAEKVIKGTLTFLRTKTVPDMPADPNVVVVSESMNTLSLASTRGWRTALILRDSRPPGNFDFLISDFANLSPRVVKRLQRFGKVIAWTVNDPVMAKKLQGMGVMGIITTNLDLPRTIAFLD